MLNNDMPVPKVKMIIAVPCDAKTDEQVKKKIREALVRSYKTHPEQYKENFDYISVLLLTKNAVYKPADEIHTVDESFSLKNLLGRKNGSDKELHVKAFVCCYDQPDHPSPDVESMIQLFRDYQPDVLNQWNSERSKAGKADEQNKQKEPEYLHEVVRELASGLSEEAKTFVKEKIESQALCTDTAWMCLFDDHEDVLKELVRGVLEQPDLDIDSVVEEAVTVSFIYGNEELNNTVNDCLEQLQPAKYQYGNLGKGISLMPQTNKLCQIDSSSMEEANKKAFEHHLSIYDLGYPKFGACNIPAQKENGFDQETILIVCLYSNPELPDKVIQKLTFKDISDFKVPFSLSSNAELQLLFVNLAADKPEKIRKILNDLEERDPEKISTPVFKEALLDMQDMEKGGSGPKMIMENACLRGAGKIIPVPVYEGEDPREKISDKLLQLVSEELLDPKQKK